MHRGMWESAVRLDGTLRHVIEQALEPGGVCEGMQLRLVGHSLGAGVASLLTLRWRELVPLFNSHGLHCHAFGPPCTLGASAAEATAAYITSVVVGDDAVCRWSLGSTKDVLQAAAILALERGATQRLLRWVQGSCVSMLFAREGMPYRTSVRAGWPWPLSRCPSPSRPALLLGSIRPVLVATRTSSTDMERKLKTQPWTTWVKVEEAG